MTRKRNDVPSERVRLDGYQQMPITDERERKFWEWYLEKRKSRQAFPMAKALITAALHGEMGTQVQEAVEHGDTDVAVDALNDLLGAYLN
jgi:hypothetical protein